MAKSGTYQEEEIKTADMHTPDYSVDYNDPRFGKVESDRDQALTDLENTYGGMIDSASGYFDEQIQASKDWADKQAQIQQDKTDFALEQIQQYGIQPAKAGEQNDQKSFLHFLSSLSPPLPGFLSLHSMIGHRGKYLLRQYSQP